MKIVLQHVSIPRPPGKESAETARAFYNGVLGLAVKPTPVTIEHLDLVWFNITEDTELHVFSENDSDTASARHFCLNVENLDGMIQTLKDAGYEPWMPEEITGRPRYFCRDPFDNIVEFTQIVDDYLKYQGQN